MLPSCPAEAPLANPPALAARKALVRRGHSRPRQPRSGKRVQPKAQAVDRQHGKLTKPQEAERNWPLF